MFCYYCCLEIYVTWCSLCGQSWSLMSDSKVSKLSVIALPDAPPLYSHYCHYIFDNRLILYSCPKGSKILEYFIHCGFQVLFFCFLFCFESICSCNLSLLILSRAKSYLLISQSKAIYRYLLFYINTS